MGDERMYLEQPAKHAVRAEGVEQHRHGRRFLDDEGRCLACAGDVLIAGIERARAALHLMCRHAEEQNLLIPLHEQRQINEALHLYPPGTRPDPDEDVEVWHEAEEAAADREADRLTSEPDWMGS